MIHRWSMALMFLLVSCATQPVAPPPPASISTTLTSIEAKAQVRQVLRANNWLVRDNDSEDLSAISSNQSNAACPRVQYLDTSGDLRRRRWADPRSVDGHITVDFLVSSTGTTVKWTTDFEATYLNTFTNTPFTRTCPSAGRTEESIVESLS